ncbi:MAG: LLM class flavin-dependent oxidoreductase [Acetobacteraceae bacterium]|nr:LLM class flavin-dependent oxidoreductase [Acetobacteraceae bacterium]
MTKQAPGRQTLGGTRKQIRLNAFDMNCVGHIQHGMWRHPRDRSSDYIDIDYWMSLARTLERGLFDGIFLADILGVYDIYRGGPETAIRDSVQIPVNDPLLLVPAMAAVTKHLGFGVTCNLTYEPPYTFARRMSTLDHLTRGRIGWNIVTGYLDSAARGMGGDRLIAHDDRYDMADDYMEAVYRLWEGSWEDGAVQRDKQAGIYADPAKLHRVRHAGPYYKVNALHLSEPSPQRTPVLYQAGASDRGRRFAATHSECVFLAGQSATNLRSIVVDIRAQAGARGRDPSDILIFLLATVVVGRTEKEARDKLEDYRRHASVEAALAHYSASAGVDFAKYDLDEPIRYVKTDANNSHLEAITTRSPERIWTKRRVMDEMILGGRTAPIVGTPAQIADAFEALVAVTDADGFNLSRTVMPECVEDFVDLVIPELQARGIYKTAYTPGTLREKLYGPGRARLGPTHPAAGARSVSR